MNKRLLTTEVMDLLARIRANTPSAEEQALLETAINAILFITSTGQRYAFADFLKYLESNAPPPVVASFKTRQEAESWLNSHPEPPDSTLVLIADQYHTVAYIREMNHRRLLPLAVLEAHLGRLKREGLPPAAASFNTREEAEEWFMNQSAPPEQTFIKIAGNDYLAVYHRNVNHRAIYPFSIALDEEEQEEDNS
ncbi:head protein [Archangium lansingense]|uniref:Head protein n=1 Tax=Archangium lansingense TaxID=2995310 RepID=A0ABT4A0P4_9BACT|nr:head protein [Archangium lansinium]MCY1075227.1 head protein [Archangium lansinium]